MPFIIQGKTNLKYILIVVILAFLVGGGIFGYYYYWMKELDDRLVILELKLPEVKPSEDENADWEIYRNEELGFEVKYPSTWESNTGPLPYIVLFGLSSWPTESLVNIWVTPESNLDSFYDNKTETCLKDFLADREAYKCEDGNYVYIETEDKGKFYFLSIKGEGPSGKFEIFNQMLSTFSFIESDEEFCGNSTYGSCVADLDCITGGCSGQTCQSRDEEPIITTCEWLDCYDETVYGFECRCVDQKCQWTE